MRVDGGGSSSTSSTPSATQADNHTTSPDAAERHAQLTGHHPPDDDSPPPQSPETSATNKELSEARAAQANVDSLQNAKDIPPQVRRAELPEARADAARQWQDVRVATERELASAANSVADPTDGAARAKAVADRANQIRARAPGDEQLSSIALDAQMEASQAQAAVAKVEKAYVTGGAAAATAEYGRQLSSAPVEIANDIALSAAPVIHRIAQDDAAKIDVSYGTGGSAAAAKQLRTLTESAPPPIASAILVASQPTVEKIAKDLGNQSVSADSPRVVGRGAIDASNQKNFDRIVGDLAAATSAAERDPAGAAATETVAKTLVQHIGKNIGRFDEAFGNAIANGNGAELSVAAVQQLKAAGRIDQADDTLQNIEDGVNKLRERFDSATEDYAKAHQEAFYLGSSYGNLADPTNATQAKELKAFWDKYNKDHPELANTQKELDRTTTAVVKTTTVLGNAQPSFAGLDHADDVAGANKKLLGNERLIDAISLSPHAQATIADQQLRQQLSASGARQTLTEGLRGADDSRHGKTLFDNMIATGAQTRSAILRGGVAMTKYHMGIATSAVKAGDIDRARTAIRTMEGYADALGYSGARLTNYKKMVGVFDRLAVAGATGDIAMHKAAFAEFEALRKDKLNGPTFDPSSTTGATMRVLGAAFAADSLLRSDIPKLRSGDAQFQDYAKTVLDAGVAAQQSLISIAGAGKALGSVRAAGAVAFLDKIGDQVPYAGAVVDAVFIFSELQSGKADPVSIGLRSVSLGGNVALGIGFGLGAGETVLGLSATAWTGVGAVAAGVAFVGTLGYGAYKHSQETSKFETKLTEDYLQILGLKPEIAHEFRNQDGDGRSPGPVISALAAARGLDLENPAHVRQVVGYLNSLSKDQMHALVEEAAHGVDPDKSGVYPAALVKSDAYLNLPIDPNKLQRVGQTNMYRNPQTGQSVELQYQAKDKRWYNPATNMVLPEGSDRWYYAGDRDANGNPILSNDPSHPAFYDPKTGDLMRIDGFLDHVTPHSVNGLQLWMQQHGYPELRAP